MATLSPSPSHEDGESDNQTAVYEQFTSVLKERAGDNLRIIFQYTPESIDIHHLSDTLLEADLLPRIETLRERALKTAAMTADSKLQSHGETEAIVTTHEDVLVLVFLATEREGLVAVLDRDADTLVGSLI